ncbi:MAG: type II toxin-antitoxin system PemK/MazF family toxin [Sulfurimonas sp.]
MEEIINFDSWNAIKKEIHKNKNRIHFRQGEIWFVSIGQNIGYEVYGKGENFLRPVVIFRKINKNTFLAIPLTSKIKEDKFHCIIDFKEKQNSAILSQVKTIDAKRLAYKTGNLDKNVFESLEKSFV